MQIKKEYLIKLVSTIMSDKKLLQLYGNGEGDIGKSFLIKTIKCWIKQNISKDTAIATPTGIAAFGLTVHRFN